MNALDARSKASIKGVDDGIDARFLDCQSMRWILIDEVSTISPMLVGLLDAFLRRACGRHFHARVQRGRRQVPFGGLNLLFCGDFWQLPPVKASAIFSGPWKPKGYSAEEQKIFKMFWILHKRTLSRGRIS